MSTVGIPHQVTVTSFTFRLPSSHTPPTATFNAIRQGFNLAALYYQPLLRFAHNGPEHYGRLEVRAFDGSTRVDDIAKELAFMFGADYASVESHVVSHHLVFGD